MKNLAYLFVFALSVAGCGSGAGGMHMPDMAMHAVDMSMPDMSQKSCGAIVLCAIQSGGNPTAVLTCGTGASQAAITQAGALVLCAYQNKCITVGGDAGVSTGGTAGLLMCLQTNCAMQLSGCMGLGL